MQCRPPDRPRAAGRQRADRPRTQRPAGPTDGSVPTRPAASMPAALQTTTPTDNRCRQTTACKYQKITTKTLSLLMKSWDPRFSLQ